MKTFYLFANLSGCRRYAERLTSYSDGTLDLRERDRVAAHLRVCAACQEEVAAIAAVSDLLRAHPPAAAEPARDLWVRLEARIAAEKRSAASVAAPLFQRTYPRSVSLWPLSVGAAFAVVVIAAAYMRLTPLPHTAGRNGDIVSNNAPSNLLKTAKEPAPRPKSVSASAAKITVASQMAPSQDRFKGIAAAARENRTFRVSFSAGRTRRIAGTIASRVKSSLPDYIRLAASRESAGTASGVQIPKNVSANTGSIADGIVPLNNSDFMVPVASDGVTTLYAPIHAAEVAKLATKIDSGSSPEAAVTEDAPAPDAASANNLSQMTDSLRRRDGLFSYQGR